MVNEPSDRKKPLFDATDWTLIKQAKRGNLEARTKLWETYSRPASALIVCAGIPSTERNDVLDEFAAQFFGPLVKQADKTKGTFRSWFRASLKNFLYSLHRKETAQKRGGGSVILSVSDHESKDSGDQEDLEIPAGQPGPEEGYDQEFAVALFSRVRAKLKEQWKKAKKGDEFDGVWEALFAEHSGNDGTLRTRLHRLRKQLVTLGNEEVRAGTLSKAEAGAEFDYLLKLWCKTECTWKKSDG